MLHCIHSQYHRYWASDCIYAKFLQHAKHNKIDKDSIILVMRVVRAIWALEFVWNWFVISAIQYFSRIRQIIDAFVVVWTCSIYPHFQALQWRHNGNYGAQITSLTIVFSTVYSGADQRKHQSSSSLAFVKGIHRWPVNSPHIESVKRKMLPFWWLNHN